MDDRQKKINEQLDALQEQEDLMFGKKFKTIRTRERTKEEIVELVL